MDKSFAALVAYHLMNKMIFMDIFTKPTISMNSLNTAIHVYELHG